VIDDGIKVVVGPVNIVAGLRQQGNNNFTVLSVGWDSFDNLSRIEEVDYNQREVGTEDSAGHGIQGEARYGVVLHQQDPKDKKILALPAGAGTTSPFRGGGVVRNASTHKSVQTKIELISCNVTMSTWEWEKFTMCFSLPIMVIVTNVNKWFS
jgi:hypothetical protein